MTTSRQQVPCKIVFTENDECFLVFDGRRIAKRQRGVPRGSWLMLESGFEVIDKPDLSSIEVRRT
jgi:hypothetical protein